MATRIPPEQIQNLQQLQAVVAGPDGANRLFSIAGQFDVVLTATAQNQTQKETFSVLIGPKFTRQQFYGAIATGSLAKTTVYTSSVPATFGWYITLVDADWDDESGQVELRIEAVVGSSGNNNEAVIGGLSFQCTILAAIAA